MPTRTVTFSKQKLFISKLKRINTANIEQINSYLKTGYGIEFDKSSLERHVKKQNDFILGMVAYLESSRKDLERNAETFVPEDKELQDLPFDRSDNIYWRNASAIQILTESCAAYYPNAGACYSLVPGDLKRIDFRRVFLKVCKNYPHYKNALPENTIDQTLASVVSMCLCRMLMQTVRDGGCRGRIKSASWLVSFRYALQLNVWMRQRQLATEKVALKEGKKKEADRVIDREDFDAWISALSIGITEALCEAKLLIWGATMSTRVIGNRNVSYSKGYFHWNGSDLLDQPQATALPTVIEPMDWSVQQTRGGWYLPEYSNIIFQGVLDSKSQRLHDHHLYRKNCDAVNILQKTPFVINPIMVDFCKRHASALTDKKVALLTDRWMEPCKEDGAPIMDRCRRENYNMDAARDAYLKELNKLRAQTIRERRALKLAEYYAGFRFIYWVATQDFRGRFYSMGALNLQGDPFTRSLICFPSTRPPVKGRKHNKYTLKHFNLLLSHLLNDPVKIKRWDDIFGNRTINKTRFEELLLADLFEGILTLNQVSQLLLIKHGHYDQVGVSYDASASAYQLMSMIHGNTESAEFTNVIGTPNFQAKKDVYGEVLKQFNERFPYDSYAKDAEPKYREYIQDLISYLKDNIDRELIKTIFMPLAYGKTASGFENDLVKFLDRQVYLGRTTTLVYSLSAAMIRTIKSLPLFEKCNAYLIFMRKMGPLVDSRDITIHGKLWDTQIRYCQNETQVIKLYVPIYNDPDRKYSTVQVSLTSPVVTEQGTILDKRKNASAFAANYTHFLDANVCAHVITALGKQNIPVHTVHDSFFIQPEHFEALNKAYREGLGQAWEIHKLNLEKLVKSILPPQIELRSGETLDVQGFQIENWPQDFNKLKDLLPKQQKTRLKDLDIYVKATGGAASSEFIEHVVNSNDVCLFPA